MTCPECRTKYTAKTINKLYLNILPKDDEQPQPQMNIQDFKELQNQILLCSNLQRDKEKLVFEYQKMEFDVQLLQHNVHGLKYVKILKMACKMVSQ